jgi:hypothetical protein
MHMLPEQWPHSSLKLLSYESVSHITIGPEAVEECSVADFESDDENGYLLKNIRF